MSRLVCSLAARAFLKSIRRMVVHRNHLMRDAARLPRAGSRQSVNHFGCEYETLDFTGQAHGGCLNHARATDFALREVPGCCYFNSPFASLMVTVRSIAGTG